MRSGIAVSTRHDSRANMFNPFALYVVGVAQSVLRVARETMRQISLGSVDTRALAPLRAIGRELVDQACAIPRTSDPEVQAVHDMLLSYTTTFAAYLDVLEQRDADATNAKRAECDALAMHVHTAALALIKQFSETVNHPPDLLALLMGRQIV